MTTHLVQRVVGACAENDWGLVICSPKPERWRTLITASRHQLLAVPPISAPAGETIRLLRHLDVDCVVPGGEFSTLRADEVARALGLRAGDLDRGRGLRDKWEMRSLFDEYGVPQPRVIARVSCLEPVDLRSLNLSFPVIVKPVDMAGSMFVRICHDLPEVESLLAAMGQMRVSSSTGLEFAGQALLEEIAVGPEYSCEVVVEERKVVASLLTTKYLSLPPDCNEVGHLSGDRLKPDAAESARNAVAAVVRASGVTSSVFHVEFRLTEAGPMVIEAAPRVAGDRIAELVELKYGWHLEEAFVRARAGLPIGAARRVQPDDGYFYGVAFLFGTENPPLPVGVDLLWQEQAAAGVGSAASLGTRVEDRTATVMCRSGDRAALDAYLARPLAVAR